MTTTNERWIRHFVSPQPDRRAATSAANFGALGTTMGLVRSANQDRAIVMHVIDRSRGSREFLVAALCDGMGGMAGGDEAAALTMSVFLDSLISNPQGGSSGARLTSAANTANESVFATFRGKGGSTLTAVLIESNSVTIVSAGDSRVYVVDEKQLMVQVTEDDSLDQAFERQKLQKPTVGGRDLVQFVGAGKEFEPHINEITGTPYKALVITSDGAHSVAESTLRDVLSFSQSSADLVRKVLSLSEMIGGKDNASIIALAPVSVLYKALGTSAVPDGSLTVRLWSPGRAAEVLRLPATSQSLPQSRPDERHVYQGRASTKRGRYSRTVAQTPKGRQGKRKRGEKLGDKGDDNLPLDIQFPDLG